MTEHIPSDPDGFDVRLRNVVPAESRAVPWAPLNFFNPESRERTDPNALEKRMMAPFEHGEYRQVETIVSRDPTVGFYTNRPTIGFAESVKDEFTRTTVIGQFLDRQQLRRQFIDANKSLGAVPGYDIFADPQVAGAGLELEVWRFINSQSPAQTQFYINQYRRREQLEVKAAAAGNLLDAARVAVMVGDPANLIPITRPVGLVRTLYGALWRGVEGAAIGALMGASGEIARGMMDPSYDIESITTAMVVPAAFGGAVGLMAGMGKLRQHHRIQAKADRMEAEYWRRAGLDPYGKGPDPSNPFDGAPPGASPLLLSAPTGVSPTPSPAGVSGAVKPPTRGFLDDAPLGKGFLDDATAVPPLGTPSQGGGLTRGFLDDGTPGPPAAPVLPSEFPRAADLPPAAKPGDINANRPGFVEDAGVPNSANPAPVDGVTAAPLKRGFIDEGTPVSSAETLDPKYLIGLRTDDADALRGLPSNGPTGPMKRLARDYGLNPDDISTAQWRELWWSRQTGSDGRFESIVAAIKFSQKNAMRSNVRFKSDGEIRTERALASARKDQVPTSRRVDEDWAVDTDNVVMAHRRNGGGMWDYSASDALRAGMTREAKRVRVGDLTENFVVRSNNEVVDLNGAPILDEARRPVRATPEGVLVNVDGYLVTNEGKAVWDNADNMMKPADLNANKKLLDERAARQAEADAKGDFSDGALAPGAMDGIPSPFDDADDVIPRNLSSAWGGPASAKSPAMIAQLLEREGLASTGINIEKFNFNPMFTLLNSLSLRSRLLVQEMVDLSGLKLNKNFPDKLGTYEPTETPIELDTARIYRPRMLDTLNIIRSSWIEGRTGRPQKGAGVLDAAKIAAGDFLGVGESPGTNLVPLDTTVVGRKPRGMSFGDFDNRVGNAMRYNDIDVVNDHMTISVNQAAQKTRQYLDFINKRANDPNVDLYGKVGQKTIEKFEKELAALTRKGAPIDKIDQAKARLKDAINHLDMLRKNGPYQNTAQSYFPRYYNQAALAARGDDFVRIVSGYFQSKGVLKNEADKSAQMVLDTVSKSNLRPIMDEFTDVADMVVNPAGAHGRVLQIPDELISDFLEHSAVLAVRHQTATLAPVIEMTKRFGSHDMAAQLKIIADEHEVLHAAAKTVDEKKAISRSLENDKEAVLALRDRLQGTAGASKDPHSWDSRTIRMLKHYMAWTSMGLSAFSQLGDLFRPVIIEGLDAVHRHGFGTLLSESRSTILKMSKEERILAGDTLEVALSSHALSAADIGDVFASRSNFERLSNNITDAFYMFNGMNIATDVSKTWASTIAIGRLHEDIIALGKSTAGRMGTPTGAGSSVVPYRSSGAAVPDALKAHLASLRIDAAMAARIGAQLQRFGVKFKSITMPNTEAWLDDGAQEVYRNALQSRINRNVPSPGAADRPIWMTKELGGLFSQFKSFGVSSMIRTLYTGLQDNDRMFWVGAAVLVGAGVMLNEIRSQLFYDRSKFNQPFLGVLADGLERSGILGSLMDVNNMIEKASGNKGGLRPALGAGQQYPDTPARLASTFLGPSVGKGFAAANVLGDMVSGNASAKTWRQMREFVPGNNLFYLDKPMDLIFPPAQRGRKPKGQSDGK